MNKSLRRQISRPRNLITTTSTHMEISSETPLLLSPHMATTPRDPNCNPFSNLGRSPSTPLTQSSSSFKASPRSSLVLLNSCKHHQVQPTINGSSSSITMANGAAASATNNRRLCLVLMFLCFLPSLYVLHYSSHHLPSCVRTTITTASTTTLSSSFPSTTQPINLLDFTSAWNHLPFSASPPPHTTLKIALFVKRWPNSALAGGLERHALTLHLALARRGHEIHVFTTDSYNNNTSFEYQKNPNLHIHVTPPSPAGLLNQPLAWSQFLLYNSTGQRAFDVVHSESVGLFHGRARNVSNLAVSWHGIAYETIHSDIVQDLLRAPNEPRKVALTERMGKVVEEVRFFRDYSHHVATSDHVGDVLRRVYMLPDDRVHVILNGVDDEVYKPDIQSGMSFLREVGVPEDKRRLVIGLAGRLVKDKGHPIMFEALKQLFDEENDDDGGFRKGVSVLVAGNGPWATRYESLEPNLFVLGSLGPTRLARFYNSLDVFVNPTLRAQGLDQTFLEAMMCGVTVMGTRFASVTGSVVVGRSPESGYTFHPTVGSIKEALRRVWKEGKGSLRKKGEVGRKTALGAFTSTKMALSYERLFFCITQQQQQLQQDEDYCTYPAASLSDVTVGGGGVGLETAPV